MSTENRDDHISTPAVQQPQPSSPSVGGLLFRSLLRGVAFGVGVAVAGPIGGIAALAITGGGDGDSGGDIGL
jgi:hypothetical protein